MLVYQKTLRTACQANGHAANLVQIAMQGIWAGCDSDEDLPCMPLLPHLQTVASRPHGADVTICARHGCCADWPDAAGIVTLDPSDLCQAAIIFCEQALS